MATINFIDHTTKVPASWLNDVDNLVYDIFGNPATAATALTAIAPSLTDDGSTVTVSGALTVSGAFTSLGIDDNASSKVLTLEQNTTLGRAGVGLTTLDTWSTGVETALQVGTASSLYQYGVDAAGQTFLANNAYFNGGFKRQHAGYSSDIKMIGGGIYLRVAGTDVADSTITYTDAVSVAQNGNVSLSNYLSMKDSQIFYQGDGNDVRLQFNGTDWYIDNLGVTAGTLYLRNLGASQLIDIRAADSGGTSKSVLRLGGSSPYLQAYYDNTEKFRTISYGVAVRETGTADSAIELGQGRTGNGQSYIDFVGDTTYTDYGLRIIRTSSGANAQSQILHRGTGSLIVQTNDLGAMYFKTNATTSFYIDTSQNVNLADDVVLNLGNSSDMRLVHSSSLGNAYIDNYTGAFYIRELVNSGTINIHTNDSGGTTRSVMTLGGTTPYVRLYYGGTEVAGTRSGGMYFGGDSNLRIYLSSNVCYFYTDSTAYISYDRTGSYFTAVVGSSNRLRVDSPATATYTSLQIYDVDNATLERVTVGAADSGGAGYKVLRIPN